MTEHLPSLKAVDGVIDVRFSESEAGSTVNVQCVLDLTDFNDLVGVEILDLRRQLGGLEPAGPKGRGSIRWAYDDEIDAFYLHLRRGPASVQRKAIARALLDSSRRMVGLEIPHTT